MSPSQPIDDADRSLSADGNLDPSEAPPDYTVRNPIAADPPDPPQPEASSSRSRPPSDTPYSPRPRLFDNLPLPDGPQASDVLSDADYRRLRSQAFSARSVLPPILGSVAVGYFSPRLFRTKPANVGIVRTGMFTVTLALSLSYTTYSHLSSAITAARHKAQHASLPRTADGQVILPDVPVDPASTAISIDKYAGPLPAGMSTSGQTLGQKVDGRVKVVDDELAKLGKKRERTMWAKGRGLSGEVEEESEMRDTYLRPGSPRREV